MHTPEYRGILRMIKTQILDNRNTYMDRCLRILCRQKKNFLPKGRDSLVYLKIGEMCEPQNHLSLTLYAKKRSHLLQLHFVLPSFACQAHLNRLQFAGAFDCLHVSVAQCHFVPVCVTTPLCSTTHRNQQHAIYTLHRVFTCMPDCMHMHPK